MGLPLLGTTNTEKCLTWNSEKCLTWNSFLAMAIKFNPLESARFRSDAQWVESDLTSELWSASKCPVGKTFLETGCVTEFVSSTWQT